MRTAQRLTVGVLTTALAAGAYVIGATNSGYGGGAVASSEDPNDARG